MSVRAHKILKKEIDDNSTFNLWHDEKLVDYLVSKTEFYGRLGDDGAGTSCLSVEEVRDILKKAKELELDEETVGQFEKDIAGLDKYEYVEYECF